MHLEGGRFTEGGKPQIQGFVLETALPRIWADFSIRDALGRVVLTGERSKQDIAAQRLLFNPPMEVLPFDEDREVRGEAHFALGENDEIDPQTWAVTLDGE